MREVAGIDPQTVMNSG